MDFATEICDGEFFVAYLWRIYFPLQISDENYSSLICDGKKIRRKFRRILATKNSSSQISVAKSIFFCSDKKSIFLEVLVIAYNLDVSQNNLP